MRHQDTLSIEQVMALVCEALPAKGPFHLTRLPSENHQVYRVAAKNGGGEDVVFKIAGKGDWRERQIPFESAVLRTFSGTLCVPPVLDNGAKPRPWFSMPWYEPIAADTHYRDSCIVDHLVRLSHLGQETAPYQSCTLHDIIFDLRTTVAGAIADVRLAGIRGRLLRLQERLEPALDRTPKVLGQPQAGEVIVTASGYVVVDWSEGFAETLLARQIDCLTYYDIVRGGATEVALAQAYARASGFCDRLRTHALPVEPADVPVFWLVRCLANGLWLSEQQGRDEPIKALLQAFSLVYRAFVGKDED